MKKLLVGLITIFTILSIAYAQKYFVPEPRGGLPQHKCQMQKKFQMLDLSNEQREAIDVVRDETKRKIIPLRADIALKRIDLINEMKADVPNRDKIMKITKEISSFQLKIKQAEIDEKLNIHTTLTPQQREQLKMPLHTFKKESKHGME